MEAKSGGQFIALGRSALKYALSASGKLWRLPIMGKVPITAIDRSAHPQQLDEKILGKSWYGIAFSHDEKMLYASGGNDTVY